MKKLTAFLLTIFMTASLVACGGSNQEAEADTTEQEVAAVEEIAEETTEEPAEPEADTEETEVSEEPAEASDQGSGRVLVAYFSATHTTEGVAEKIAEGLQADLYEIVPEEPYTEDDLNYNDNNSRSTLEMNDASARPAISGSVENMDQYDVVFLGYPIWWGEAPRIIDTFVESYDFSGKTIIPFCTSGGSGMGSSATDLEQLTSGAEWLEGQRLSKNDSQDDIMKWVNSLGVDFGE